MKKIKNVAIIAHVDHGKTTLVDQLLKQSGTFRENETVDERVMDSNAIEKERGITILAKTTAINYKDYRINILDTPGHADFGGEVERIMNMVDGVLLVVDAYEGTMPQTRFVLKKALEAGVTPILVVNKIDKPTARPLEVVDEVLDLFIELGANEDQLEFPVVYASALSGTSSLDPDVNTQEKTMDHILDLIINTIPDPTVSVEGGLQFQPALLDYNDFVGRIGIGVVKRGKVKVNQTVSCMRIDGSVKQFRIAKLFGFLGLKRIEIEEAEAGDIIAIAGLPDISVGETVCELGKEEALPLLRIDEPTLQMTFGVNTSPFVGREGKIVTARKIEERLIKETEKDVSLKIEQVFNLLKGPVSWFVMFMFIKIIYTMAPDRKLPSSCTTYGAIFTTILWIIITAIYSYYITHFAKYDLFYGGLANLVILMLWVYFLAYVFVIGMCLNHNKEIEKLEKTGEINIK